MPRAKEGDAKNDCCSELVEMAGEICFLRPGEFTGESVNLLNRKMVRHIFPSTLLTQRRRGAIFFGFRIVALLRL